MQTNSKNYQNLVIFTDTCGANYLFEIFPPHFAFDIYGASQEIEPFTMTSEHVTFLAAVPLATSYQIIF